MNIIRTKKYSALEILEMAFPDGVTIEESNIAVADVFGKYAVVIGGIAGITDPGRKIIVDGTEPVEITVGNTSASLEVVEPEA